MPDQMLRQALRYWSFVGEANGTLPLDAVGVPDDGAR
jgi:hypothetical protein